MGKKFISEFLPNLTTEGLASVKTDLEIITDEERAKLTAATAPIELLNASERKTLSSYDPDGVVVGVTRVIQTDTEGILWSLVAADVTLDASWIAQPYSTDPDGTIVINMELADFAGIVPDLNVFGQVGGVPSIGNGVDTGGNRMAMRYDLPSNPAGIVRMVSTKTSNISVTVKHDGTESATGICYSVDGGTPVYGAVAADTNLVLSIPHNGGAPVEVYIWSARSASSGKWGNLTYLDCGSENLASLDVSGLTELTYLNCYNNNLTSLDVSGLTALTALSCYTNSITSLLATGVDLSYEYYGSIGSEIWGNALTEDALIALVDSLATTATGLIIYGTNTGSAAFETWLTNNPTLDKGYIWNNS